MVVGGKSAGYFQFFGDLSFQPLFVVSYNSNNPLPCDYGLSYYFSYKCITTDWKSFDPFFRVFLKWILPSLNLDMI